jgi:hypothetical protein
MCRCRAGEWNAGPRKVRSEGLEVRIQRVANNRHVVGGTAPSGKHKDGVALAGDVIVKAVRLVLKPRHLDPLHAEAWLLRHYDPPGSKSMITTPTGCANCS